MNKFWSSAIRRRVTVVAIVLLFGPAAIATAVTTRVGATPAGHKAHGFKLVVDVLQEFSGPTSIDGPITDTGCYAAQQAINGAGGILGHPIGCVNSDTKGDAADALSVVEKVLASTSHLIAVLGPGTLAPALAPVIAQTRIPMFSNTTDPHFDHNTNRYFFRILPSDSLAGVSLAYYAIHHGFKHVVAVWNTTTASQTNVPSFKAVYKNLGGKLAGNFSLAPDQTNYRTEALAILNAKPDAIVMDSDPRTAATLFSDLKQLGKIPQVIMDSTGEAPTFISAVGKVIGMSGIDKFLNVAQSAPDTKSLGYKTYYHSLLAAHKKTLNQYAAISYAYYGYTGIVLDALALVGNKTVDPSGAKVLSAIKDMTIPRKGKMTVHTYAQGLAALKRGISIKKIYYLGAYGLIDFNKYNNASATFQAARDGAAPTSPLVTVGKPIPATTLSHLLAKTGL